MARRLFNLGKASPKDRDALRSSSAILNQRALQSRASKKMRSATKKLFQAQINQAVKAVSEGATSIPQIMRQEWSAANGILWTPFLLAYIEQGKRFFSQIMGLKSGPAIKYKKVLERIITEDENGIPFGSPDIAEFILESARGSTRYMADLIDRHITKEANKTEEIVTTGANGEEVIIQASKTPAQIATSLSKLPQLKNMLKWRSTMLARTFTIWGYNKGALDSYQQAGVQQYEWLTAKDDLVCPFCRALDGKTIPVGGAFYDSGQNPNGIKDGQAVQLSPVPFNVRFPPLHPSCRCTILPVTTF